MCRHRIFLFRSFLVLALAFASSASAQEATHDLRIELRPDLPLLAELRLGMQYTLEVSDVSAGAAAGAREASSGKKKKLEFEHESRLDFVDEVLARDQPEAGDVDVRRTFLMWQADSTDERGKTSPQDNALNGAQALLTLRKNELSLELLNRLASDKKLAELLKQSESVSWMKLPDGVRVGDSIEVEPAGLVNLMLDGSFVVQSARATLTLRSVDEKGVAALDGPLMVMANDPEEEGRATFEGTCSVTIDTLERRVQGVQWKGHSRLLMVDGQARAEGQGEFDSRLAVKAGAPALKALERKTTYRLVPRHLKKTPLTLELPSHWDPVEDAESESFRTTVHGYESPVTLEFQTYIVASHDFDAVVDAAVRELERDLQLSNQRTVQSPLGEGRSMRFKTKGDDGTTVYGFQIEFYPCGSSHLLRIRLIGPEDAFEREAGDWSGILRSLEMTS